MKKLAFIFFITCVTLLNAQTRGIRIGYIDMDYILDKVPQYAEANNQLEQKAQKWKTEMETKRNEINKLKEALASEKVLLTKELIEEREDEIKFLESELLEYQNQRFGAQGDLILQKKTLVKPIQDQVFTIVQDIAEAKKFDYIFDKSSDMTMLFAAQRHDISELVVRQLTRSQNREQLTKKQQKEQDKKEALEDMQDENPELAERQNALDERKAAREKLLEDRKKAFEERRKAAEERRQKALEERNAKKNGTVIENDKPAEDNKEQGEVKSETEDSKIVKENNKEDNKATPEELKQKVADERAKKLEERKKELQERRKKILEEREAAKQKKETENNPNTED